MGNLIKTARSWGAFPQYCAENGVSVKGYFEYPGNSNCLNFNMVTTIVNKIVAGVFLVIIFPVLSQAQNNVEYQVLNKYRNWGIFAGPVLYDKAMIARQYGDYSFVNKQTLGYNFGFEYNFNQSSKWSFSTGLIISKEPIYNLQFTIKKVDLIPAMKMI